MPICSVHPTEHDKFCTGILWLGEYDKTQESLQCSKSILAHQSNNVKTIQADMLKGASFGRFGPVYVDLVLESGLLGTKSDCD